MSRRPRHAVVFTLLGVAVLAVAGLRLLIGREPTSGSIFLEWAEPAVRQYRVTALAAGAIVGGALAVAGVMLQALLRNVLASPFVLGLSSGAGLGYMAAAYLAQVLDRAIWGGPVVLSTMGAMATLGIVFVLARRHGQLEPVALILIGVVVSTVCSAGMLFFQHLVDTGVLRDFTFWVGGRIDEATPARTLVAAGAVALAGVVVGTMLGRAMDAATLSDDEAESVGVRLGRLRTILFIASGVLTAMTVALAGPIGFVGLVAPHIARVVLGPSHGALVIGAALTGVVVVVGADVARQAIDVGAGRMPIGIFTAVIGGPTFIWLLQRRRGVA